MRSAQAEKAKAARLKPGATSAGCAHMPIAAIRDCLAEM
jgi:hypothetical protein